MKQFVLSPIRSLAIAAALSLFMVATPVAHAQTNLSPSLLSFATTAVTNNSAPKTLTLSNGGNAAINISGINMIGGDFDQTNNCGKSLAAKKTCTINVVFNPTGTGNRAALISVSYSGGLQLALLSGTAISQTTISPTSATFASQPVNSSSAASAISLKNNQNIALAISKISTTGDFAQSNNCGTSLAAGAACTISTTFKPTATGARTGSVTVASNATPTTQSIALSGTGSAPVTVSPASLAFSTTQTVGVATSAQVITIKNLQGIALPISSIAVTGDYTQTNSCGTSLAAGASCAVSVVFKPTTTGNRTGNFSITNGAIGSPETVSLAGAGVAAVVKSIAVTPATASIVKGKTQQFTATASYTSGTVADITATATWTSSAVAVAPVGKGMATGMATGTATMTASMTGSTVTGAASLTVTAPTLVSVAVTPNPVSVVKGKTQQFTATGTYSDGSTQNLTASATWTSATGATISTGGIATATAVGTPLITAKSGTISGTATMTVQPATLVSIAVTPGTATIAKGKTQQYAATGTYTDGSTQVLTSSVIWTSGAGASIVNGGLATGTAVGAPVITATSGAVAGTATLTVQPAALVSIAVTPASASIAKGLQQQFVATGTYTDNTTQVLSSVTWTVTSGASISPAGLATGTVVSASTITATNGAIQGTAALTVQPAALVSIAVSPATASIAKGLTQQYNATGTYTDATTQDLTGSVTWSASVQASIASNGLATAMAVGTPTITATSGAIQGTAALTVQPAALVSIAVSPATASIAKGLTQQYSATGTYTDASTQNLTGSVTWSASAQASIASSGLATAMGVGTPTITATSGAIQGTAALTVQPAALVSIAVSPATASIAKGLTQQYSATGTYTDATTQDLTSSATWNASAQATIASTGLATAMAVGTPTITATSGSISGAAVLTVQPATLLSIAVTPSTATIVRGSTQQFIAQGTFTDASVQDISSSVSWNASAGASVAGGLATGTDVSTPTITASSGSISGSASLTVQMPALVSITVSPASVSLGLHSAQQFTAMGTYADNSTADITHSVVWNTGNSSVVSVSGTGMANVLASSSSAIQISAISNGIPSNIAWLSALAELQPSCSAPTLDMKLLVVTNGQAEADFAAIKQGLDYLGTPYTVFDMSTQIGGITADMLSDGNCHGYYQGVIFTFGNYIYTLPGMPILTTYEQTYHVRQVNWFVYPDTNFGINTYHDSVDAYHPYSANFTPAAEAVFSYANTDAPLSFSGAFIYLSTPVDGSVTPLPAGASVTPLLTDASGNALSVIYNLGDGREYLSQTFDSNQYLMHNLILSYGLINWVTKGVFLGEFHVYASPQVDDVFINDHEWAATTPCHPTDGATDRTDSDADTLGTVRMAGTDVDALLNWMTQKQQNPLLSNFVLHLAFNGMGISGNTDLGGYNPDTLTPELVKYQSRFKWISHTYDHPDTLNGQTAAFDDAEILQNNQTAAALGLTYYNPANMVTPGVTGLNDSVYVNQAVADGVKYVVTDTSVLNTPNNGPNPSPNVGMPDTLNNGLYLVPRHANNLYFNVATPGGWTAEYQCIYSDQPQYAGFNYQDILDNISQSFVANMIKGDMDPQMFHQPNLVAYDGTHSLIGDLYDNTFNLYLSIFKLPVLSPTLDQLGQNMQQRNQYNLSGATASVVNAGAVDAAISITVPSGTTVPSAVVPVTGLNSNGAENYAGQNISHITVGAGQTITLPLQ